MIYFDAQIIPNFTCDIFPLFSEEFLDFWMFQKIQFSRLSLYFPCQSFPQGILIPFHGKWHLEAMILALGLLTTIKVLLLPSRPFPWIELEYMCVCHINIHFMLSSPILVIHVCVCMFMCMYTPTHIRRYEYRYKLSPPHPPCQKAAPTYQCPQPCSSSDPTQANKPQGCPPHVSWEHHCDPNSHLPRRRLKALGLNISRNGEGEDLKQLTQGKKSHFETMKRWSRH